MDADVTLHTGTAAGHAMWSDEIRLRVGGGPSRHLASLLRPMLLSDFRWWLGMCAAYPTLKTRC